MAQNIFIGREPRQGVRFMLDEKEINAQTQALFDLMHLKLDPRTKVADLTVAKQQMVEIAKALSFNSQVLIMDEPTAALTETEIDELFRIIRQLRDKGVGIVYISHRLEELKQISDRITVMRDGRYDRYGADAAKSTIDQIISMMVGRTIYESAPEVPEDAEPGGRAGGQESQPGHGDQGRQLQPEEGRNSGLCRADGRRAHRSGARAIFGADHIDSGEVYVEGKQVHIKSPEDAVQHGIGYLSEDRKRYGLALGMDVEANIVLAVVQEVSGRAWAGEPADETRTTAQHYVEALVDQDAESAAAGQEPLRRQPAEGRHRQMADRRHRHPDLRRADARHRRGREERNLPAAQRPGRSRASRSS